MIETNKKSKDIFLKAVWKEEEKLIYKVEFYFDDVLINTEEVIEGNFIDVYVPEDKVGYIFTGWEYDDGETFSYEDIIAKDIILKAVWIEKEKLIYKVKFYSDDVLINTKEVIEGNFIDVYVPEDKVGYIFTGWVYDDGETFSYEDIIDKDIILKAKYEVNYDVLKVNEVKEELFKEFDFNILTEDSPLIIFPNNIDDVTIVWTFNNPEFLNENGKITQPSFLEGDKTVKFSAEISKNDVSEIKEFEFILKAKSIDYLVNDDFTSYEIGDFKTQGSENGWTINGEKLGNTTFEIVDTAPSAIPGGSKALKIQAGTEAQMMLSLGNHRLKHLIVEFDVMQTAKNATNSYTSLYIQDAQGGTTTNLGYGVKGNALYFRITGEVDNDTAGKANPLEVGIWYTVRADINLETKILKLYQKKSIDTEFTEISVIQFTKDITYELLYFRSGSSAHFGDLLCGPIYIANLKIGHTSLFE